MMREGEVEENERGDEIIESIFPRIKTEDICLNKIIDYAVRKPIQVGRVQIFNKAILSLWLSKYFAPSSKAKALKLMDLIESEMEQVLIDLLIDLSID